jgi:hypothetical protein
MKYDLKLIVNRDVMMKDHALIDPETQKVLLDFDTFSEPNKVEVIFNKTLIVEEGNNKYINELSDGQFLGRLVIKGTLDLTLLPHVNKNAKIYTKGKHTNNSSPL